MRNQMKVRNQKRVSWNLKRACLDWKSKSKLEASKSEDKEEFLPNKEIANLSDDDTKNKKKKPTKTTVCKDQKECARAQQQGNFE
jgi:hypothetical protein